MTFILGLLSVLAVVGAIVLMVVILLQEPKGGGLAAALGGSGMEAIGVNTGSVNRFTTWVATAWVACCFLHALLMPFEHAVGTGPGEKPAGADTGGSDAPPPGDDGK